MIEVNGSILVVFCHPPVWLQRERERNENGFQEKMKICGEDEEMKKMLYSRRDLGFSSSILGF